MSPRMVFYSFHFDDDGMRAQQIINIGIIDGNNPVAAHDWDEIIKKGDIAVKKWINDKINCCSCLIVLVGEQTSKRPFIKYEIEQAWNNGKGLLGIYIHDVVCPKNGKSSKGDNPFDLCKFTDGSLLSTRVMCYNPNPYDACKDISDHLLHWIEQAIAEAEKRKPV